MAAKGTTIADVNLQVDGSGFERAMNSLLLQVGKIEKALQGLGAKTNASVEAAVRKDVRELQKLLGQINSLEKNANSKGFGRGEELRMRRELNALEARGYSDAGTASRARMAAENQIRISRERLLTAAASERRVLYETVKTEQLRLAEIGKQEAAIRRLTAAREREARAGSGPSILPTGGMGTVLARTAAYAAAGSAIFAVGTAAQSSVGFTVELEEKLAKLGAISGSTKGQMEELSETILNVSRNSAFSTAELTDASTTLAQAGFSAQGIASSLQATSNLALAAGTTMAEAVDVVTSAIGAFQLQETEAATVADSLTAALNKSKLTIQQVALGIQYAGTTAYEQGINFQELTSIMGAMAQAGVRSGSTIGTGLRQLFVDLQSPSEKLSTTLRRLGLDFKDIDVATLGPTQVLKNLAAAGFNSAEAYGSLETRAAAAYLVVKNNLPFVEEMQLAQARSGTSTEAAAKAADNLASQWQRLKNNLGADSTGTVGKATQAVKDLLKSLNDASSNEFENNIRKQSRAQLDQLGILAKLGIHWKDEYNPIVDEANEKILLNQSRIEAVSDVQDHYRQKIEDSATATAKANDATSKQETTMHALNEAIARTVQRQGSLKEGSTALQIETVSLASRFVGLAEKIDMSTNSAGGLIAALQQLRAEESLQLAQKAQTAVLTGKADVNIRGKEIDSLSSAFKSGGGYGALNAKDKKAFDEWRKDPLNVMKQLQVGDIAKRADPGSAVAVNLTKIVTALEATNSGMQSLRSNAQTSAAAAYMATASGQRISAKIDALGAPGASQAELKAFIGKIDLDLKNSKVGTGQYQAFNAWKMQAEALLGGGGALAPEKAKKATAREDGMTATRNSIYDVQREVERMGGTIGERVGKDSGGHKGAGHKDSRAFDVSFQGGQDTDPKVIAKQNALALKYQKQGFTVLWNGERYGGDGSRSKIGTGANPHTDHMHIEEPKGGAYSKNNAETNAADDEERRKLQAAKRTAKLKVSNADKDLKGEIDELEYALSEAALEANKQVVKTSFEAWEKALREQAEVDTAEMDMSELAEYNSELEEKIAQKAEDTAGKITDGYLEFFERMSEAAELSTQQGLVAADREIARIQGQIGGLDRASMNGKVPDYVRTLAARRLSEAQEGRDNTQMGLLPSQIGKQQSAMAALEKYKTDNPNMSAEELQKTNQQLDAMGLKLFDLTGQLGALEAAASAGQLISTDVGANVRQAITAWEQLRGTQQSWAQTIGGEVAPALDFLEGGLNDMFNNVANGSRTALQAFGDMAKGMLKYIQQLVLKILASKIIELLMQIGMSAFGGGGGFTGGGASAGASAGFSGGSAGFGGVVPMTLRFNGGPAPAGAPQRLMRGGRVANGARGYDSVNAELARDEFVVRSAAVKSVGVDFMNDLNTNGARAMKGMQSLAVLPSQGKQETNVYVVKQDAAPTMGPNDVLVTIQEDILRDGATKRLIKHVAAGG